MKKLITTFFDLVKVYSPSGQEIAMTNYLESSLKKITNFCYKDKYGNVFARIEGKGNPLFFSAHMDTVEPGKNIKPQVKNGYLISDGTTILGADNKVAVACFLETARFLRINKIKHRPVEFIFTKSEEVGNYGAINFEYSLIKAKTGYCFDSVMPIGTIVTASPYYERFDLKLVGKAAHASKPEEAQNALILLNKFLNLMKLGRIDKDTLVNIGVVSGGTVRNTIPGEITLNGEIRSFDEKKLNEAKQNLLSVLKKIVPKTKSRYKIDFLRENPGYKFTNASIKHLIETITHSMRMVGMRPKKIDAWGVSDANIFNTKGLTCINLGDGVENAHTIKERIRITDMEKILKLILSLIQTD